MDKIEFLSRDGRDLLQRLSYMIRYNNAIHIHNENVAEHSFYVAIYSLVISKKLGYESYSAVKLALVHDVSEAITSDIPHDVKYDIFNLANIFERFEKNFNKVNFGIYESAYNYNKDKAIVDLADVISVMQYAEKEVEFGNKDKFGPIYEEVKNRILKCKVELEKYFDKKKVEKLILDIYN